MRTDFPLPLIAALLLCVGCAGPKPGTTKLAPTPAGYSQLVGDDLLSVEDVASDIPVYLVSGRNIADPHDPINPFGTERTKNPLPALAIAKVAVGPGLSPREIADETLQSDGKHVKTRFELKQVSVVANGEGSSLASATAHSSSGARTWVENLSKELAGTPNRSVTIFVHGFNTQLITNTELAAEIAHFQKRDTVMVSYEWPSEGNLLQYFADKANANYSTRHFRGLLALLADEANANEVNIIAHSAGNPVVVNALRELRLKESHLGPGQLRAKHRINRVVLAAPDMDMEAFMNATFDRFHEIAKGVAIYASADDKALSISSALYGNERLGRSVLEILEWEKQGIAAAANLEMIDVSLPEGRAKDFLGHSYFHRDPWVSADIQRFLLGRHPTARGLSRRADGLFWEFTPDYESRLGIAAN